MTDVSAYKAMWQPGTYSYLLTLFLSYYYEYYYCIIIWSTGMIYVQKSDPTSGTAHCQPPGEGVHTWISVTLYPVLPEATGVSGWWWYCSV